MERPLEGCALKLARAWEHMNAFQQVTKAHRESGAYRLRRRFDRQASELSWTVESDPPLPLKCSAHIGDALYNMHSALDHLMWRLAERAAAPESPEQAITFPIFKNRSKFWRKDRRGAYTRWSGAHRLTLVPEDARALVEELQPYQHGDDGPQRPLWLLHELSNCDKHRTLHIAGSATVDDRLEIRKLKDAEIDFRPRSRPLEGETEIGRLTLTATGPNAEIEVHPQFAINEVFDEGGPAAGQRVAVTLNAIYEYLTIEVFEKRFVPYFGTPLMFRQP